MGYEPFGQLPEPRTVERPYQSVRSELVFEDGAVAQSAGFEPGVRGWAIRSVGSAEFQGDVVIGGELTVGPVDGSHIKMNPGVFTNEIRFSHELEDVPFDIDNVGMIRSVSGASAEGLELWPPYNDDTKAPRVTLSQGAAGVFIDEIGDTTDTHMSQLVYVDIEETDTVGLHIETPASYATDIVRIRFNGRKTFAVRELGVYTDYSANSLPRTFWRDLGSRTNTGTGAWESHATIFDEDVGTDPITISAVLAAYFQQSVNTTGRDGRVRLRISVDGGSTWTNSNGIRADHVSTAGNERIPVAATFGRENVTPTGNVQVEVQFWAGGSTDITLEEMQLKVDIVGDS